MIELHHEFLLKTASAQSTLSLLCLVRLHEVITLCISLPPHYALSEKTGDFAQGCCFQGQLWYVIRVTPSSPLKICCRRPII